MGEARRAAFAANAAARGLADPAKFAALAAGPFVASHSDRDRSQRRARRPIASPVTAATAERLAGDQFMIVETGQLELADSNVTPDFVNHRAATEDGSLWLRTAFSSRRRWRRHDDGWILLSRQPRALG